MQTSTARVREFRQRRRIGRIQIMVEIDEARLVAVLEKAQLLTPLQADDRNAVESAAQEWLDKVFGDNQ